mmetsp:Transcript_19161/g.52606  ORF Transcript_19161/g.52606 Transcript_19161/m.52606 type:complete len:217 (-) Transcript_19161:54-704(-)
MATNFFGGGWNVSPSHPAVSQELVNLIRDNRRHPCIGGHTKVEIKGLIATHGFTNICLSSYGHEACQHATEPRKEIRDRQEDQIQIKGLFAEFFASENGGNQGSSEKSHKQIDGTQNGELNVQILWRCRDSGVLKPTQLSLVHIRPEQGWIIQSRIFQEAIVDLTHVHWWLDHIMCCVVLCCDLCQPRNLLVHADGKQTQNPQAAFGSNACVCVCE